MAQKGGKLESNVQAIITNFSKVLIKANHTHEDTKYFEKNLNLYAFAHQYFLELEKEQREISDMSLEEEDVAHMVGEMRPQFGSEMTPKDVEDTLTALDMNAHAAVELCKLSLEVAGDRIDPLHVAAFAVALVPSTSLFDTLQKAMSMFTSTEMVEVVGAWAMIDKMNAESLMHVAVLLKEHPGLTVGLLQEMYPAVVYLGSIVPKELLAPPTPSVAPKVVQYNAGDTVESQT